MSLQQLANRLQETFATGFVKAVEWRGDLAVTVTRERLHEVAGVGPDAGILRAAHRR